jgi:hypothetical protein
MRMLTKIVTGNSVNVTAYPTKNANLSGAGQRVPVAAGSATRRRYEIVINSGPTTLRC